MQGTLIKMTEMNGCYCSNSGTSGAKNVKLTVGRETQLKKRDHLKDGTSFEITVWLFGGRNSVKLSAKSVQAVASG